MINLTEKDLYELSVPFLEGAKNLVLNHPYLLVNELVQLENKSETGIAQW